MGKFSIDGTINVEQFWPTGTADADTCNIFISITSNRALRHEGQSIGALFDGAHVKGKYGKNAVVRENEKLGKFVAVRFQGIDAPELHVPTAFNPFDKKADELTAREKELKSRYNRQYRQAFARAAAWHLRAFLTGINPKKVPCQFVTDAYDPNDTVDVYGRFVGEIFVKKGGTRISLAKWLLSEGWVLPSYYEGMSTVEISSFNAAWSKGKKKRRITRLLKGLAPVDPKLLYALPKGTSKGIMLKQWTDNPAAMTKKDEGALYLPKLFRRQIKWWIQKSVKVTSDSFYKHLGKESSPDYWMPASMYLNKPAADMKRYPLTDSRFMSSKAEAKLAPESVVFYHQPTELLDANGHPITSWD